MESRISRIISNMNKIDGQLQEIEKMATVNKPNPFLTALVAKVNKKIAKAEVKLKNIESRGYK